PSQRDPFEVLPNLRGITKSDVGTLRRVDVNIWLAMNAGYAAVAGQLRAPVVPYFHGNDFLKPWVVSTPFVQRLLSKFPIIRDKWRDKRREYDRARIALGIASTVKILTNSRHTKELIHSNFGPSHPVFVCHPGVDDRFFQASIPARRDDGVLRLLTVSRLERATRRKNVAGVLEALSALKQTLPFNYSIVGDGDDLESLRELCKKLGLAEQVNFLGRVSDAELLGLYRSADLFVLPVKALSADVEGFGIVYLEANAAGVPVLCSVAGGATDAVVDGETGIVLRSAEPGDIAEGILRFAHSRGNYHPDRLRKFAANFIWELAAARIEGQLLGGLSSSLNRSSD